MDDISNLFVSAASTIREAIKIMDKGGIGLVCVNNDEGKLTGIVTDGDFRRAILQDISLDEKIIEVANRNFKYLEVGYSQEEANQIFRGTIVKQIPIIDVNGKLFDVITEEDFYGIKKIKENKKIDCAVVIMAGGKGTRLDPFTRILPKPLIPIGDKTILEMIIDKFVRYEVNHFYLSVNHKAKIIKSYFEELNPTYKITYLHEDRPLGTIGAIKQLEKFVQNEILLTNCDIIIEADYYDVIQHHRINCNDITIVASLKNYSIPYGVCEIENGGSLVRIQEKPEYGVLVNTGMYIINPDVLQYIPGNELFHATHLIEKIKALNKKIGVYPISEKSWSDTGEWMEYKKAISKYEM